MKRTICVVLLLAVCGCGAMRGGVETAGQILGFKRTAPAGEPKPPPPPAMQEAVREVLAGAVAVAVEVEHEGAEPHDPDVAEQRAGLQAMQAPIGVPIKAPETLPERQASRADLEGEAGKQRKREDKWEAGQAKAAAKAEDAGWSLHSGALGTYILMGAGASLAAVAWRALRKAGKAAAALAARNTAFGQVVGSVSAGLAVLTPDQEKAVKGEMAKVQDTATEAAVAEVKTKVIGAG